MNTEPVTVDLNDFPDLQNASPQTEQLDPADMAQVGDSPAMQEVTLDPKEAEQLATRARHAEMVLAGVQPFQSDTPTDDELAYAKYLRDEGHLKNPDGPGFWHAVGDMISSTAAGVPEVFIEAGRKTAARFGTEQEQKEALAREEAFSAEMVNKTKAMYEALAAGSQRLVGKAAKSIVSTLPEYDADPAFRARVQKDDDLSWYRLMRKMTVLSKEQQMVHDEAADIAIKNGWSASGLENATNAGTFAADPGQLVLGAAMGVAGKGIGAAARAVGLGEQTAALGVADAMRAEVMANAARISTLEKAVARTSQINTKDGAAMYQFWNAELGKLSQTQAVKEAALKALDESNAAILKNAGRPSILGRAAGTAVEKTGSGVEAFGNFLSEMNQGVVDRVLNAVDANAPKWLVHAAEKAAPTAVAGGVAGAAMSDDTMYGFLEGAAAGALAPGAISNAGRLARILGENYLIGRTTIPYFARMATDAEANGLERWAFRQMDKFSPAVEFSRNLAVASGKGAAVGAGLGYVAAGGEDTDLTEAAASGVAGHFTPWGFISSVHGFWSPVRTPAEYQGMQAANIRALRERWAGSDNLARFDKLNPSQQASVSSVLAANPDVILRLIGTDDAVIKADQLARGQIPQEGLANVPGFHYSDPVTGRSVITLNPQHPDAMRPVLAHEFWHKAQAEGIAQSIVTELLGDTELGLPGLYTEKAPDGTLRTTAEFAKAKAEYEARLKKSGVTQTLTDAEFAMEHASEQGADFVMSGKFDEALRPTVGSLMLNLMPEAVRNAVGSTGAALNADGSIRGTMNLGLKPSPAVEKLLNAYMNDWRVGRNREAAAGAKNVEITREQILANPQVLEMFRSSSSLNVDPATGQIAGTQINPTTGRLEITDPKKVFKTTAQMAKEQAELTQVVMDAVKNAKDTVSDRDAVKVTTEKGREVAMGRYLSDETLASIEKSGRFNAFQLEHIKNLNALTKAGTGNHVRFFYQPADVRGRYGSLAGHWREEVPYSWHISKQDNVLFRTVSHDKVVKNLDKLWEKHNDRATALWSSQVSMFADARTYLGNLSAGREGKAGLSEGKRDFLNLALGINTTDRAEVNPLYDEAAHRRLDSFITARRIDRTNRITLPERSDKLPWSYDAYGRGRVNATAGEGRAADGSIIRELGANEEFAKPPTDEALRAGMQKAHGTKPGNKSEMIGAARELKAGTPVDLRIDIPTFNATKKEGEPVYAVTVHERGIGKVLGYDGIAAVDNPTFHVREKSAEAIRDGANKTPIAVVQGEFNPSREMPADIGKWTPTGFDPKDHSYFYDKTNDKPVVGGSKAISVGNTVFVKDAVYGDKSRFRYTTGKGIVGRGEDSIQFTAGNGNEDSVKIAAQYVKNALGREYVPHANYDEAPEPMLKRIADYFQNEAKHAPDDPDVLRSYEAMARETVAQLKAMMDAGIKVEPFAGQGEPYASSADMMKDVRDNKHLYFLRTENAFGQTPEDIRHNPLLERTGIKIGDFDLLVNDAFRVVHDFFGHTQHGFQFGPRGEFNAWKSHSRMFSEEAQGAVAAETLAQNAWVNYGEHLRRKDGSIPKKGEEGYIPPQQRPFGEQKNFLVPQEMMQFSAGSGERSKLIGRAPEADDAALAVSSRNPTAGKRTENPMTSRLTIEGKHVIPDNAAMREVAKVLAKYPNFKKGTPSEVIEQFQQQVKDNLLWLHDQMSPELRERAKQWYVGGRKVIESMSDEFSEPRTAVAGAIAALSPKNDWFVNIEHARRAISIRSELKKEGVKFSEKDAAFLAGWSDNEKVIASANDAVGKTYDQLSPAQRALWVRSHDGQKGWQGATLYSPEGDAMGPVKNASGKPTKVSFGMTPPLAKALAILDNPSLGNIHKLLGKEHKIRSFYNNLLVPHDAAGDVTIDTHAVGAGLLTPVASNDKQVGHNFGTGVPNSSVIGQSGLYGIYADAYRAAAKERGILPREMQSITWEAVRGLFPAEIKNAKMKNAVAEIWQSYKDGTINIEDARTKIHDLAGGVRNPPWAVSDSR